jgi:nucleoside-diphosphate-sugar epimerase
MRIFSLSLMLGKQPTIFEDGRQIRDFVNIQDVVSANLLVLESSRSDYQVFNIGGNQAWTVMDFYNTMQRVVNRESPPGDVRILPVWRYTPYFFRHSKTPVFGMETCPPGGRQH